MRARESRLESPLFGEDMQKLSPIIQPGQSDSASFDNALEPSTSRDAACRTRWR